MDASEPKQSRVTNTAIQSQLIELSVRFARMENDIQEIKSTLLASGEKVNSLEKSEAGRYPLIERRLDNLEKRTDKHGNEIDAVASAAQFGLTNPLLVAWEVVPFSFVVDWFLPVGDYLEGLTSLHGLKLSETSLTVHRMVKGTSTFIPGPESVRNNFYRKLGHTTYDQYLIERTLGLPSLPLPKLEPPFSVVRGLNAIALLRQLLRS